ncbi:MAG: flagellar protein FlaG [Pseudomonadota bacterium]
MSEGIGAVGAAGTVPAPDRQDPANQARMLQKYLDRELDGIPSPTHLRVSVDPEARKIVVQVIDAASGDVLRQIPRDDALRLARALGAQARGGAQV